MKLKYLSAAIAFVSMGGASVVNAGVYNYNPNNYNVIDMRKHTTPVPSDRYLHKDKNLPSNVRVITNERNNIKPHGRPAIARDTLEAEVMHDPAEPIDEQKLIDESLQDDDDNQDVQLDDYERPIQKKSGHRH